VEIDGVRVLQIPGRGAAEVLSRVDPALVFEAPAGMKHAIQA
jgi:hypothetical protein